MRFLKDDILLSRFLQFSLLSTVLLLLVLLFTEPLDFTNDYEPSLQNYDSNLSVEQPLDSLQESSQHIWFSLPLEWLEHQIDLSLGEW